jgi:hypothetical protein
MPPVLLPNVSGSWLAIGAVARMRPSPRVGSHVVSTTRPLPSSTSPSRRRPRRQRRVIASLFCSRIAMILTSVRVGLPARRRAGERAGRPMRLRTGAAVSRACFQSHEICTVNFMAISAIASGSSLLAPTLTSASMPRVPRKVTAVPDETPKLTF